MYQWRNDGVDIPGANSATYAIAEAAESDEGEYRCVVSNAANSITSTAATLTVCKCVLTRNNIAVCDIVRTKGIQYTIAGQESGRC